MPSPKSPVPEKPPIDVEVGGVTADDFGVSFVEDIRVPGDTILAKHGGDLGVYEKLRSDWQVQSAFQQRRTAVVKCEYYVEPGGEDAPSVAAAEDLKAQLDSINFDRACYKSLTAIFDGYSVTECLFRRDGTKIVLADLRVRKARRFRFDRDGGLRLVTRSNRVGTLMPPTKFWVFRAGADDDDEPYGLGLGHHLYWPIWLKRNAIRHWALFVEEMARGRFVASHPAGIKKTDMAAIDGMLERLTHGGSARISDNVKVDLIEALRNSGGDYKIFAQYFDSAISKVILSQTMTTDDGSSLSQAQVHNDVKEDVIKSDADLQCESFNNGPVRWLTAWNHPSATAPKVWRNCTPEEDQLKLAERDTKIAGLGFDPSEEYIQDNYGPGWRRKGPATPATTTSTDFAEGDPDDDWRPIITPTVDAIDSLAERCQSAEEFRDRLGEIVARDDQAALVESLAQTMFAGRVAGRVGADLDARNRPS